MSSPQSFGSGNRPWFLLTLKFQSQLLFNFCASHVIHHGHNNQYLTYTLHAGVFKNQPGWWLIQIQVELNNFYLGHETLDLFFALANVLEGAQRFTNLVHMGFLVLEKAFTVFLGVFCEGIPRLQDAPNLYNRASCLQEDRIVPVGNWKYQHVDLVAVTTYHRTVVTWHVPKLWPRYTRVAMVISCFFSMVEKNANRSSPTSTCFGWGTLNIS